MTAKETIEIISRSSLWKILSVTEKVEAACHALYIAGVQIEDDEVIDLVGEVYGG